MMLTKTKQNTANRIHSYVRFSLTIILTCCISEMVSAQVAEQTFDDNRGQWFIGLGLGPRIYFADHAKQLDLIDRLTLGADLYVGKWWGPYVGTRIGASFQTLKGATQEGFHKVPEPGGGFYPPVAGHRLWRQQFDAWHFYGDLLFNVSNIFQGPDDFRFWDLIPFIGIGHVNTWDKPAGHEVSFSIGLLNSLQLSRTVDLNFDIRGAMFKERFKVGSENFPAKLKDIHDTGERPMDGILSVNVGVTFHFGAGSNARPVYIPERIQPVTPLPQPVVEKVTEWKDVATDVLILFRINQSVLLKDARVQIGFLARLMHEYPEGTYTITGYADEGTGTPKINDRLSRERAERVKECLIKEYGISPSRLKTIAAGGIENRFYNDPALSRSVIIRPNKY